MNLSEYLKPRPRGARRALAVAIGVNAPDVSSWLRGRRPVPIIHCVAIERVTDGAVTRKDLRPDDWRLIWPELEFALPPMVRASRLGCEPGGSSA
ncbi:transcriptional regulator [Ralstonia pseudosolanacearum]|nr:YdaS family helix-turn-helix protein [Ralstonia pseudosolanacearum]AXV95675.1 hypothetical protein CJO80_08775 [Ralstonia solanacearum]